MDFLFFLLMLSPLILVHELGHFLAAKFFGVKVLTFSFGIGPKVFRFRPRETEYCLGIFPLGGYVRLLERGKDEVDPREDRRTFEALGFGKRVLIVLAGPAMNLVFPVLLYFSVFVQTTAFLAPSVGAVLPGYPADGQLQTGDRVMAIDDEEVGTFEEVRQIIADRPGEALRFRVFRDNQHVEVEVTPVETVRRRALDIEERIGTIGIHPTPPAPVIAVPYRQTASADSSGHGLRTFDLLTHVAGKPVRRYADVVEILAENRGETVPVTYLRPVPVDAALGGLAQMAVYETGVAAVTPKSGSGTPLERVGFELADPYVGTLAAAGALRDAGLLIGDKLLELDGTEIGSWSVFEEQVRALPPGTYPLKFSRGVEIRKGHLEIPTLEPGGRESGPTLSTVLGGGPWVPLAPEPRVEHPTPIRHALSQAIRETADVSRFLAVGVLRLLQGRLSLDQLSGPLTIYEVASEEREKGADYFIWLMALISINLGLLNLLPIPVLDGGALVVMSVEGVLGRSLPGRVRGVAQAAGLIILVLLMGVALRNDVERRFQRGETAQDSS